MEGYMTLETGLLMDINSQGRIPHPKETGQYLEIHRSYCLSSLPEHVLKHADHISLIDDSSLSHLSELVKENLTSKRVVGLIGARISVSEVFPGLKSLFIDCCPMLTDIFPFSKLPKKLENLKIKFCAESKELFNPGMSAECNLQTLDLLELPKLVRIGVIMVSLRVLKVRQCPNLENLEVVLGEAENLEIHISYAAGLKTVRSQKVKPGSLKNLEQLKIESCPQLKEVYPTSYLPPNLEILVINSCESLETIFRGSSAGSSLSRLRFCSLPCLSSTAFKVPGQCHVDSDCPNLQIERSG
ncbi:hypothetical protein ACJRO7_027530 [Eucalyptus globulus]|uniref:Disease resistance protein At4g27190-like leucine-rich repeats domain-containing protein n=1 Tax=Eucalyptus globulus TaxID=34317 RepID=A0ABD3K447_EUCGL